MIWNLIGVIISGLSLGGIAALLVKISRNRLPKWIVPTAAGLGMFGYLAFYDYAWYGWKQSQLPDGVTILEEQRNSTFFRPWSYVAPAVNYFSFIDNDYRGFQQNGQHLIQYYHYEMFHEYKDRLETTLYIMNCDEAEQIQLNETNTVTGQSEPIERNSLLHRTLCP